MKPDPSIKFLIDPENNPAPESWDDFERLINHHRYFHNLERVFRKCADEIPPEIKNRLKETYKTQLQNQLLLANELQLISRILNREKVVYLNLKGIGLALQLYGKITERFTRDIDFVISEEEIDRALDLFHASGYKIIKNETHISPGIFRKIKKNQTLIHPEKRIIAELHWELFSNRYFYSFGDKLMKEPQTIDLNGISIKNMNRENAFIYLCLHGAYHEYFRLFWLRDIAKILQEWDLNWQKIIVRATEEDILRVIASSAILAGKLYNLTTPFDSFAKDPKIRWLVDHTISVINRSSLPSPKDRIKRIVYFLTLKRSWKYKIECVTGIGKRYWIR